MPYPKEATVRTYNGIDCWRTWFLTECEQNQLFGTTEKYLNLINTDWFKPYEIDTLIYLEDAPFFHKTNRHRICGPYQIIESNPDRRYKIIRGKKGKIVIYKELYPEKGPWYDKRSATRTIDGLKVRYKQLAREYGFFPFRFSITRAKEYQIVSIPHSTLSCEFCFPE